MDYKDIERVNSEMTITPLENKYGTKIGDYVDVPQRVKAFRKLYPDGCITTEMVSNVDGVCIFEATVFSDDGKVLSSGHAYEKEGSNFINSSSYIENCETSAVGRALGFLGLGIETSICSAEEVGNTKEQQSSQVKPAPVAKPKLDEDKVKALTELAAAKKVELTSVCKRYKVKDISDLTEKDYKAAIRALEVTPVKEA